MSQSAMSDNETTVEDDTMRITATNNSRGEDVFSSSPPPSPSRKKEDKPSLSHRQRQAERQLQHLQDSDGEVDAVSSSTSANISRDGEERFPGAYHVFAPGTRNNNDDDLTSIDYSNPDFVTSNISRHGATAMGGSSPPPPPQTSTDPSSFLAVGQGIVNHPQTVTAEIVPDHDEQHLLQTMVVKETIEQAVQDALERERQNAVIATAVVNDTSPPDNDSTALNHGGLLPQNRNGDDDDMKIGDNGRKHNELPSRMKCYCKAGVCLVLVMVAAAIGIGVWAGLSNSKSDRGGGAGEESSYSNPVDVNADTSVAVDDLSAPETTEGSYTEEESKSPSWAAYSPTETPSEVVPTSEPSVETEVPTPSATTQSIDMSPAAAPTSMAPTTLPTRKPNTARPTIPPTSQEPTKEPTIQPRTSFPTQSPTSQPTRKPTIQPTTSSPTRSPTTTTPTSEPTIALAFVTTQSPSKTPDNPRKMAVEAALALHRPFHAEAFQWLVEEDEWEPSNGDDDSTWLERYAMVATYFSAGGNDWIFDGGNNDPEGAWLSTSHACWWHETACDSNLKITALYPSKSGSLVDI